MPQDVVDGVLATQLHSGERGFERVHELRVLRREAWSGRRSKAAIAEQEAQGVRIQGQLARLELRGLAHQRQLEAVLVVLPQAPNHLRGLQYTAGLPVPSVVRRRDEPQMLGAAESRGAVLGANAEDLPPALGEDAEHGRRVSVGSGHQIPGTQRADGPEARWSEHLTVEGCARPRIKASGAISITPRSRCWFTRSGSSMS